MPLPPGRKNPPNDWANMDPFAFRPQNPPRPGYVEPWWEETKDDNKDKFELHSYVGGVKEEDVEEDETKLIYEQMEEEEAFFAASVKEEPMLMPRPPSYPPPKRVRGCQEQRKKIAPGKRGIQYEGVVKPEPDPEASADLNAAMEAGNVHAGNIIQRRVAAKV